jgi:fructuronate reductase
VVSRLSLRSWPAQARPPAFDPARLGVGIVHLGVGAFHRAHQAVFTEDALPYSDADWGICGFTQRSATVRDQLAPQDGLYTLLERGAGAAPPRVIGVLRDVRTQADDPVARMADPAVRLVTLTVTEKGYNHHVVGQLVDALARRRATHGLGLSILSCDNLSGNGTVLSGLVTARLDDDLAEWACVNVAFPSSVVDRIVPATTAADRAYVRDTLGYADEGVVVAEPFKQWVIEDTFAAGRPAWERAGAVLTADVTPYERAKLRLLNGTHSLLAYTGALAGYDTIDEALADPTLGAAARALMVHDAAPTLHMPDDFDLAGYQETILDRFANLRLRYRTVQVAGDGSMKLPIRLLGTVRDRLAAGAQPVWASLGVAAWMVYVARGTTRDGRPLPLDDPIADDLHKAVGGREEPAAIVDALLGIRKVFDEALASDQVFRALLVDHVAALLSK